MHNRVGRTLLALGAVLALLTAVPATTASADTIQTGNSVCSMYVNAVGFGAYCSSGKAYMGGEPPPTWRERLNGRPFVPCRDFEIPKGIRLPQAPEGKTWVLRITITDYNLNSYNGGPDAHLERAYMPVDEQERAQCPFPDYMEQFWWRFESSYPDPALQIMPTYTPRVNIPAFFTLTPDSSMVLKQSGDLSGYYDPTHNLTMRGMVVELKIDPGDGTGPFICPVGVTPVDDPDGYDQTKDPDHQLNPCKHVYKKSSASQPDGMYTVKLTITWEVSYWIGKGTGWKPIGQANVTAVQRLPVQEVQAIGG
ncbi:hypothetical protein [Kribbella speibonae]|uniref:Secreted protein n=1 Tax=Kribbella speibonae TaxID=1572660 RepID=A0A4R0IWJ7_9ACTN|nr:hypothetical protein [Kribbella speibonae]TCC25483.1 hypothetical protein E0H58_15250 [Kribbella speibonae]TCC37607.1 hypothetical protein E0H92_13930 [Kribbella speibonae]